MKQNKKKARERERSGTLAMMMVTSRRTAKMQ